jgi:hypothetical protein
MLLHCGLGHDQVGRDLPGGGRRDECLVRQSRAAQRSEDVNFAARQFGRGRPAKLHFRSDLFVGDTAHPAASGAKAYDITILENAAGDWPAVHPRPVPG